MKTYISYLRQSTIKQQICGLGIEAQREIIKTYVKDNSKIHKEYIETETGKNNHRPRLAEALEQCKQTDSILICAKLDRLFRNVAFTSRLLESDVEIVFCNFPKTNRLILHIISSIRVRSQPDLRAYQTIIEGKKRYPIYWKSGYCKR